MTSQAAESTTAESRTTTVDVKLRGHVRAAVGEPGMEFTFEGDTLREVLDAFFEAYEVQDLVIAETEDEATAPVGRQHPTNSPARGRRTPRENRPARTRGNHT